MLNNILADYIRLGYAVLPLIPNGKTPLTSLVRHGLKEATTDLQTALGWFELAPDANVGLLAPERVLVLDFDRLEVWDALRTEYPELERAPRQKTPRGGRHVFLRLPPWVNGQLSASTRRLDGADLRGMGRAYVAAAPSVVDGKPYVWEVPLVEPDALPEIPPRLLRRLLPPPRPVPTPPPSRIPAGPVQKRLEGLLRWACEVVAKTPAGKRHNTLFDYARAVGGWLHHGLDEAQALEALAQAGIAAGLPEREAYQTARDGLEYGKPYPLDLPPEEPLQGQGQRGASVRVPQAPTDPKDWPTPEPLESLGEVPLKEFPREEVILPRALEDYAAALADRLRVPLGAVALPQLAAASAVIGGKAFIAPDRENASWEEPANLWVAVVGEVSTGKTPILNAVLRPLFDLDRELREDYEREREEYERELEGWKAQREGDRPKPPKPRRLVATDITKEALAELLAVNPAILCYQDELSGLFRTWRREDRGAERSFYISAYTGTPHTVDRIGRAAAHLERPVLALLGFVQPGPFAEIVREAVKGGDGADGLLQRFLLVWAELLPWTDDRPEITPDLVEAYAQAIRNLYNATRAWPEEYRVLHFDEEAQELWRQWEKRTQLDMRNPDHTPAWRAYLGKRGGLTARLALVLGLLHGERERLSAVTLQRAITTVLWAEPHARRVWARALNGDTSAVVKLAQKIRAGELEHFTLRDLYHKNIAGIATAEQARLVVAALEEARWVLPDPQRPNGWVANPKCREMGG